MKTINEVLNHYTRLLVTDGSKDTAISYQSRINGFLDYKEIKTLDDFNQINLLDVEEWYIQLQESGNSLSTRENKITALNSFCEYLVNHNFIDNNPCEKMQRRAIPRKPQVTLTREESILMLEHATNIRMKAIIALCLQTGMRVSEVLKLELSNIRQQEIKGKYIWTLDIINAKGMKNREVYLDDNTFNILKDYISVRPKVEYDNVFISDYKKPMKAGSINKSLKVVARRAGIDKEVTIHSFRRSMATRLNNDGVALPTIKETLGHSDIKTTMRYINVNQEAVADAFISSAL